MVLGRNRNPARENAMTTQMLETFTATLTAMLEKTMTKMRLGMDELTGEKNLLPDLVDRASMEADRNFALLMSERDRQTLARIHGALNRIKAGEYGICEHCEEDIAVARLKVQPTATLCVHCQSRQEDEERLRTCAAAAFFAPDRGAHSMGCVSARTR